MDRTLYLNENKTITVLRDGPSVWIREEGKAGRRIPARLIGRVVIIGNLKLETDVITLFTDNDIPVTLMNRAGDSAAVVMPYVEKLPQYYEKQKTLLMTSERINRFKDWLYAQRRQLQFHVVQRLSKSISYTFTSSGFREKDYRRVIEEFRPVSDEQWQAIFNVVSVLFRELVVGHIMMRDLDPHIGILNRRYNFGLALDICHILEPEIELQSVQFARAAKTKSYMIKARAGWSVSAEGMKDVVHRFENRRDQIKAVVERLIDDIFELMRELRK
jgi:CRISPR/Cas system-associated endonuclease Cas1